MPRRALGWPRDRSNGDRPTAGDDRAPGDGMTRRGRSARSHVRRSSGRVPEGRNRLACGYIRAVTSRPLPTPWVRPPHAGDADVGAGQGPAEAGLVDRYGRVATDLR